eukprot:TRINITY_DN22269_c0_g1_i1.p1 TRINITY_DN22269_c0_g1~~TRINITY_DN22269_c0_g1_i1.p1  ORF type:complete len:402 (-),score=95.35 TRINITY_DN22269_c0_g1_i1:223-1290(-)
MSTAARADASAAVKPWRLSASVVVLAAKDCVPASNLTPGLIPRQDYRVCLVQRAARSSSFPDVMVFPGGAVDAQDEESAKALLGNSGDALEATVRCAAVREVFEESGISILKPSEAVAQLFSTSEKSRSHWREAVRDAPSELQKLLNAAGAVPDISALKPWCSFVTPDIEHMRLKKGGFDTRFFIWIVPPEASEQLLEALADGQETTRLLWLTPDEALEAQKVGNFTMAPPQWFILQELAEKCTSLAGVTSYASDDVRALQRDYPIKPHPMKLDKSEEAKIRLESDLDVDLPLVALAYPGDEAHPIFPGAVGSRHRMIAAGQFPAGVKQYKLERSQNIQLPLKEMKQNWRILAKL